MTLELALAAELTAREPYFLWAHWWILQPNREHLLQSRMYGGVGVGEQHPIGRYKVISAAKAAFDEQYTSHGWQSPELAAFISKLIYANCEELLAMFRLQMQANGEIR